MNQKRGDKFIYNAADPVIQANWHDTAARKIAIRKGFFQKGSIRAGKQVFDMKQGGLRGPHNMFNAVCAIRAALFLGAAPEKIQSGLNSFAPPPHRLEKVAEIGGVTWINDSKATNVDSVFYALQAMERPTVWIVGGQDKGNDYTPLIPWAKKKVKAIVCMGLDNSKIVAAFKGLKKPIAETKSAQEAVKVANSMAIHGDAVLLSPACASFDLFKNYEDRGEQFRLEVLRLANLEFSTKPKGDTP
jgi:UDP-N-acetylmuramoylalanine--D-glutamate ligase